MWRTSITCTCVYMKTKACPASRHRRAFQSQTLAQQFLHDKVCIKDAAVLACASGLVGQALDSWVPYLLLDGVVKLMRNDSVALVLAPDHVHAATRKGVPRQELYRKRSLNSPWM